jgi:hypothetical protein
MCDDRDRSGDFSAYSRVNCRLRSGELLWMCAAMPDQEKARKYANLEKTFNSVFISRVTYPMMHVFLGNDNHVPVCSH